jgi:hypothetical protein
VDSVVIGIGSDTSEDIDEEGEEEKIQQWSMAGLSAGVGWEKYALFLSMFARCFVPDDQGGVKKRTGSGKTHYEL